MTKQDVRPLWLGLSAGAAVAVLTGGLSLINSETVLRSSFATALTHTSIPAKEIASAAPVSGSEEFWLSAMRRDGNAPVTKTINVGDRIALSLGGERRSLQVATVADFSPQGGWWGIWGTHIGPPPSGRAGVDLDIAASRFRRSNSCQRVERRLRNAIGRKARTHLA